MTAFDDLAIPMIKTAESDAREKRLLKSQPRRRIDRSAKGCVLVINPIPSRVYLFWSLFTLPEAQLSIAFLFLLPDNDEEMMKFIPRKPAGKDREIPEELAERRMVRIQA
jgi:hypothetical protein